MLGNNGNQLAQMMHDQNLLKNGMSLEECESKAKEENIIHTNQHFKWIKNDDFWEDFSYRAGELGYELKI